ncbi:MAG: hypothetical protein ACTIBU_02910 [Microbacterium gubbeenense]
MNSTMAVTLHGQGAPGGATSNRTTALEMVNTITPTTGHRTATTSAAQRAAVTNSATSTGAP